MESNPGPHPAGANASSVRPAPSAKEVKRAWFLRLMRVCNDTVVLAPAKRHGRVIAWRWLNSYAQNLIPFSRSGFEGDYASHVREWLSARTNAERDMILQSLLLQCNREIVRQGIFGSYTDELVSIDDILLHGME